MITAIVFVHVDNDRIPEVAEQIAAIDGISEVYSVTGRIDLIAIVRVASFDDVAPVVAGEGAGGAADRDSSGLPRLQPPRSGRHVLHRHQRLTQPLRPVPRTLAAGSVRFCCNGSE